MSMSDERENEVTLEATLEAAFIAELTSPRPLVADWFLAGAPKSAFEGDPRLNQRVNPRQRLFGARGSVIGYAIDDPDYKVVGGMPEPTYGPVTTRMMYYEQLELDLSEVPPDIAFELQMNNMRKMWEVLLPEAHTKAAVWLNFCELVRELVYLPLVFAGAGKSLREELNPAEPGIYRELVNSLISLHGSSEAIAWEARLNEARGRLGVEITAFALKHASEIAGYQISFTKRSGLGSLERLLKRASVDVKHFYNRSDQLPGLSFFYYLESSSVCQDLASICQREFVTSTPAEWEKFFDLLANCFDPLALEWFLDGVSRYQGCKSLPQVMAEMYRLRAARALEVQTIPHEYPTLGAVVSPEQLITCGDSYAIEIEEYRTPTGAELVTRFGCWGIEVSWRGRGRKNLNWVVLTRRKRVG